ncbi:hypothetical protein HNY73_009533 [Argiope bruennichi]|uniref:DDE Tnp4 domain-containing protein n=1 Tax=Argiope bruennichi TaxID=94029 RepID=A0A8T0FFE1_ARGBR|nr:hypothetical protein HNY73_009533 [Argiope bruennichi]
MLFIHLFVNDGIPTITYADAEGYRRWLRMNTASFEYLLSLVSPHISGRDTNMRIAITAGEKLAVTLRYLASGETQSSLSFQFRIAQNTISGIIKLVCNALVKVLSRNHLHVPSTKTEWEAVSADFYSMWQFPQCIDVGTNGRISDGGVWGKCKLKSALDKNALNIPVANTLPLTKTKVPYVIVADDAFPLSFNLMKPYPGRGLNEVERIFNGSNATEKSNLNNERSREAVERAHSRQNKSQQEMSSKNQDSRGSCQESQEQHEETSATDYTRTRAARERTIAAARVQQRQRQQPAAH